MRSLRFLTISLLFLGMPATLLAGIDDLPDASKWYFYADFQEMRSSEAGQHLYGWLQREVFDDIREDVGVDLDKEANSLTAYSVADNELVLVIDGNISQETEDKIVAMGAAAGSLDKLESSKKAYYHVKDYDGDDGEEGEDSHHGNVDIEVDSFDNGAYFTFAIKNKLIVTSTKPDMEMMLANKGRIEPDKKSTGALFVLSGKRSLIQAGAKAGEFGDEIDFDSNILSNAEQVALLIAEEAGRIAIEAQLVTTEKEMADSLASIARGLIALQVFNDDLDPEVAEFLQNTTVNVDNNKLVVKVSLDPQVVVETLE